MDTIYCLVPKAYWQTFADKSEYVSRDYAKEGFIHATKGDELLMKVANRIYTDFTDELWLLVVDVARLTSRLLYEEASDGNLYPHIYGPLNKDAIIAIKRMSRTAGQWTIGEPIGTGDNA